MCGKKKGHSLSLKSSLLSRPRKEEKAAVAEKCGEREGQSLPLSRIERVKIGGENRSRDRSRRKGKEKKEKKKKKGG